MTLEEMLKNRHTTRLSWAEPWQGVDSKGNPTDVHVELRASVHNCINFQRAKYDDKTLPDDEILLSFIAINWAEVVE